MRQFEDKVALVTGGSSGIGRAAALAFAREGAKVVVANIRPEGGMETVRLIQAADGEAVFIRCDVSKSAEVESLIEQTVERYGHLDCAFNNAGIPGEMAPINHCSEDNWDDVIEVNLKGIWLCLKYEIMHMLSQGKCGAIVNSASIVGLVGGIGNPAYVASKHGVVGLTKAAALEYAKAGIRVNAICPGGTRTPMLEPHLESPILAAMISQIPLGRIAEPDEIANAVLWLCSDQASYVTGHALVVDGGFTAQ